jgi:hypothetical protein
MPSDAPVTTGVVRHGRPRGARPAHDLVMVPYLDRLFLNVKNCLENQEKKSKESLITKMQPRICVAVVTCGGNEESMMDI